VVARYALELGIFDLMSASLRALGPPEVWISVSRQRSGVAERLMEVTIAMFRGFAAEGARPDKLAFVQSGMFDEVLAGIVAVERIGTLQDVSIATLLFALETLKQAVEQLGCREKIRAAASALKFLLDNPLADTVLNTGSSAAKVCAAVFGRDEGGSEFSFTQEQVDGMIANWADTTAARGWYAHSTPTKSNMLLLELVISDANKTLLLKAPGFLEYLLDGLLLDPDHPRQSLKDEQKIWLTAMHAESFAQLAAFAPGREALLEDPDVKPALEEVRDKGLSEEAREFASAALLALSDKQLERVTEGQKHVMLSCESTRC
jgi:hypothetical protein